MDALGDSAGVRGPTLLAGRNRYRPAMTVAPANSILIVDFGSQVTQLIARRVREAGVYCEIAPFNAARGSVRADGAQGRDLLRRAGVGDPGGQPEGAANTVRQRRPFARHLLRPADAPPATGRAGRHLRQEGIRAGLRRGGRAERAVRRALACRREAPGVDEPRRPRRDAGAGLRGGRGVRRRAVRDRHQRSRPPLFDDVPPGGRAHPRRRQVAGQFRAAHLRLLGRLDDGRASATPRSPTSASRSGRARSSAACPAGSTARSRRC